MATVIYKPADNRWGEIGSAFGKAFYEREQRKKAEEAERARREAYNAALGVAENAMTNEDKDFNTGRVYKEMASALDRAGATDQLDDMMELIINGRAELQKRKTVEQYTKNIPKDSPAAKRMEGMQNADIDTLGKMSEFEKRLMPEKVKPKEIKDREFTLYNPATGEERPGYIPENVPHGQEDAYIAKQYGTQWTTVKPAPEEEPDEPEGERNLVAVNSRGEKREVFVPKSVEPGQEDSYVREKYGSQWRLSQAPEAPAKPNAKDIRDVEAQLVRKGVDPSQASAKQRAGARNIVNNEKQAIKLVAQNYGKDIVEDALGNVSVKSFRGEDSRIKYKHAAKLIDDKLYDGMSPADAALEAEKEAEIYYKTGEWMDPRIQASPDVSVVKEYLAEHNIEDPELVHYIDAKNYLENALEVGIQNPALAKDALARILRTRNPELSEKEIQEEVERTLGAQ